MTQDEFDAALAEMGALSYQKTIVEGVLRDKATRLGLSAQTLAELAALLRRRDGLDSRLDVISSALAADPTVDALSAALDADVVEMLPGVQA